jgi:integrase/recombinase XerD
MRRSKITRKVAIKVAPTEKLLGDAFEEFIMAKEVQGVSPSTIRNYEQSYLYFREFNRFDEDEVKVNDITANDFREWIFAMEADEVSHNSINHYLRDIRAFLYWCMDSEREYIQKPFKIHMIKGQEEPIKCYSEEDIAALMEKPRASESFTTWRTWAMVNWFMATGNRTSTVCKVKLSDIDWETRKVVLAHTKNKSAQITIMNRKLVEALKEYMSLWDLDSEYLFPDSMGDELSTNALRHAYAKYCHDRGVKQTNLHGLRHTFAKDFIKGGGNTAALQAILGHKTPTQTLHYAKMFGDDLEQAIDTYNPLDKYTTKSRESKVRRKK